MAGPVAPKDAEKKRPSFYIMRNKQVAGSIQPNGTGTQFIYLNDGRMISSSKIVGNIEDEEILNLLTTTEGFRKLIYSIGVTVETDDPEEIVDFAFQMYGKTDLYGSGTTLRMPVKADGMEYVLKLDECEWSDDDAIPGQARFEFKTPERQAIVAVRFYLNDGYSAPEPEDENPVNFESPYYKEMIDKSLMQTGNNARLKKAIDKARNGEDVTIAFIGGSITQGAGAVPINTECYAYKTFKGFCDLVGKNTESNVHYVKAGVGGTPSELGMLRYERDVLDDGKISPDVVVVEFAVNDEGDETKGECYDSLVRKIYDSDDKPAVILLFAVFANDWNLQERLGVVGKAYDIPMVSTLNSVVEQFYKTESEGRVVTKNQYFYDCFHPTNVGHTVMADGIINLFKVVDNSAADEEIAELRGMKAPLGSEFESVKLLDRNDTKIAINVNMGDFNILDEELQGVERDMNLFQTKEFPYNWKHARGNTPFSMDIECSALIMINKDSASPNAGCAEVFVDGEKVLLADPKVNGWTHCNPLICFRGREKKNYHVEVKMQPGDEDKDFTILGFGYVD